MYASIARLLHIKNREVPLVRSLFLVQFLLGAAVAFFYTASLTLFIANYAVRELPVVYMLTAVFLLVFSLLYARVEARFAAGKLLQLVMLFAGVSVLSCWLAASLLPYRSLTLLLLIWNMVLYLLIGYAFWGVVALLFDVREGKRLASVVGAGDLPAKMLGYLSVPVLVPFIGVTNLFGLSVACLLAAFVALQAMQRQAGDALHEAAAHHPATPHRPARPLSVLRYFHKSLILSIAAWALVGYAVFFLLDFTFLSEIKLKKTSSHELATFISVFFAAGRLLAILFKLVFSSRVMARLGLANTLLVSPAVLLLFSVVLLAFGAPSATYLYVFGAMVLLAEVLRSTLQDPAVFVLFQPLAPHSRLKGHVIKGYMFAVALFVVGAGLTLYLQFHSQLGVGTVVAALCLLLVLWGGSVLLVRRAHLRTLVKALQKGFFTGTDLFLQEPAVQALLVQKTQSAHPQEALHALDLLERAGYTDLPTLLIGQLQHDSAEVREYVLGRIIELKLVEAVPALREQLEKPAGSERKPSLLRALFYLGAPADTLPVLAHLDPESRQEALVGLLLRGEANAVVAQELAALAGGSTAEKLRALHLIAEAGDEMQAPVVEALLQDNSPEVYQQAMVAAGRAKCFQLVPAVAAVAERRAAYHALRKALLAYGDAAYRADYWSFASLPDRLLDVLFRSAGKTVGSHSTALLEAALVQLPARTEQAVEALWEQKATLTAPAREALQSWVSQKLRQCGLKQHFYEALAPEPAAALLQEALCSELQQDLQRLLKALALLFDRQRISRVWELYQLGRRQQLANAVEMLEMLLPAACFTPLNALLEFLQEVKHPQPSLPPVPRLSVQAVMQGLLGENKAGCNAWTRSVACYLIPRLEGKDVLLPLLEESDGSGDRLFHETKSHVLSRLSPA